MFVRGEIEAQANLLLGIPHSVSVLTPYSFRLRPVGVLNEEPGYSVVAERSAFRMRARVVFDPLGRRLRVAILAGAASNPAVVERLEAEIARMGWVTDLRLTEDDLFLGAADATVRSPDEPASVEAAVIVAAALSDFVLSQLVVTRPMETRPAVLREISEAPEHADVWEYDPTERDRATVQHRLLENWLIGRLQECGIEPLDPVSGPQFDLAWKAPPALIVCEVKSTGGNETKQLRLGLGQVLHYQAQASELTQSPVIAALLVEHQPDDEVWLRLCAELGVTLFWPTEGPLPIRLSGAE